MNNNTQPLVVGLIYEVVHDSSIDYTDAETWISEEVDFRVAAQDMKVRFDFNEGHQTVEEAIFAVQSYIDRWEFKASVEFGPGKFALRILRPILQVQASPGDAQPIFANVWLSQPTATATITTKATRYPTPPAHGPISFDQNGVAFMYRRYIQYREGRASLLDMTYACFTTVVNRLSQNATDASHKYKISQNVLGEVAKIASTKGGDWARKELGIGHELTSEETRFLLQAVRAMIARAAIVAGNPNQTLPEINKGNLFTLSPWDLADGSRLRGSG